VEEVRRGSRAQDKEPVAPEGDDPVIAAMTGAAATVAPPPESNR
jgi:hypothetical protein